MLARIAILSGLALSLCMADNFLIKGGQNADSIIGMKGDHGRSAHDNGGGSHDAEKGSQEPMRVVIEDINPNSELGQAIHYMVKEAQKKELAEAKASTVKKVVKKKPKKKVVKKVEDCVKPVPQEHIMEMSQMPSGEAIKAKEAPVVDEKPKAEVAEPKAEAGHGTTAKEEHGAKEEKAPKAEAGHSAAVKDEHKKPAEKKAH